MASSSKRLQLTLNAKKEREKVILDYLSKSFNPNATIKEILYNFISTQGNSKIVKDTQKEYKKRHLKRVKNTQIEHEQSNSKMVKDTQSEENTLLDLSGINDTDLVNEFKNENPIKQNELNQLKEFMR